ncbi:MAG: S9 family peptidase, partial [Gemmatimonadota bacterium]
MMTRRIGMVAMLSATIVAGAHGQASLLPRMLSAPFPEDMVAASAKSVVAWVNNAKGVRNVWVASAPDYKGRQLTAYATDDGQEISELSLSPDGATVFYVRGGGANRRGEIPNPTSDPAGQEQNIWRVSLTGGAAAKVAAGTSPEISPKGDLVVFASKGQIWSAPVVGAGAPQALIKVRGGASNLVWSPDGSMIAFASRRTDHGFVGIYAFASHAIRWLDPTYDFDSSPVWSPDGKQIAFIRIPAGFDPPLFGPIRESPPWSIRVANAATGVSRQVWMADRGQGSVLHGVVGPSLLWGADDRLVFPWEKDGWSHLYSVSASGGGA